MAIEEIVVKGTRPKTGDEIYNRAMMGQANVYGGGKEPEQGFAEPIDKNNLDFLDQVEVDVASINPGDVPYRGQMFDKFGNLIKDVGQKAYDTVSGASRAIADTPILGDVYKHSVGGFSRTPGGFGGKIAANIIPPLGDVYSDFGFKDGGEVGGNMYENIDLTGTVIDEGENGFIKRKLLERLSTKYGEKDEKTLLEMFQEIFNKWSKYRSRFYTTLVEGLYKETGRF